ncbi:hypothetical protein IWW52_004588, partial [Coemansia sp. RSA 2704]
MTPEATDTDELASTKRDHSPQGDPPTASAENEQTEPAKRQRIGDGNGSESEAGDNDASANPLQTNGGNVPGTHRTPAGKTVGGGKRYSAPPSRNSPAEGEESDDESAESMSDEEPSALRPGRGKGGGKMFSSKMLARKALSA